MLPPDPSYRFQTGDTRTYRFQVADTGGYPLCEIAKEIVYGADYNVPAPGLFAEKSLPVPSGAIVVSDDGFGLYLQALGAPPGFMPPLPGSLFVRPILTPIRPDLADFLVLYAEP